MNEREYQELKKIRQQSEQQTQLLGAKYTITGSAAMICLGIVVGGLFGAVLILLGALIMLSPVFLAISHLR